MRRRERHDLDARKRAEDREMHGRAEAGAGDAEAERVLHYLSTMRRRGSGTMILERSPRWRSLAMIGSA